MTLTMSTLDALIAAARGADREVHKATAHGVAAFGVGIPGRLFDRAANTFAERVAGTPEAAGNSLEEILERGHFDLRVDGRFDLRIVARE